MKSLREPILWRPKYAVKTYAIIIQREKSFAKIAPFPVVRICVKRSFENTGLDLAGRAKERVNKNYIFSFTCTRTWAVHLEDVSEMTTPRLLQAL
ncbi:hypothetical protein T07_2333 [Trichinella nelsoni]|uniref:Uncharacterized protein n=1 Tax=Trichinella nelsoni TaxID=6336 RepID=A0A0V0SFR4_9BILA|nr:hypothetical protein T07_2333 [Trichinella nelsoni]